jgi:hypothetical protein
MAEVAKIKQIVYKGAVLADDNYTACVIALGIPEDARVVCGYSGDGKQRANKAITLAISPIKDIDLSIQPFCHQTAFSIFSPAYGLYEYRIGWLQTPTKPFNSDPNVECASGIHFFAKVEPAIEYGYAKWSCSILPEPSEGKETFVKFAKEQAKRYNTGSL